MTNDRILSYSAAQWTFCPWCGRQLEEDQNMKLLVRREDDYGWDQEKSEDNGFNFYESVKHCGFDVRIWLPVEDEEAKIE